MEWVAILALIAVFIQRFISGVEKKKLKDQLDILSQENQDRKDKEKLNDIQKEKEILEKLKGDFFTGADPNKPGHS